MNVISMFDGLIVSMYYLDRKQQKLPLFYRSIVVQSLFIKSPMVIL